MVQEVKYNGQTAIPDDYSAPDGDLEVSLNLIHEDGALKPIPEPKEIFRIGKTERLLCIHKTANFTHYILANDNNASKIVSFLDEADLTVSQTISNLTSENLTDIIPFGNMLVCLYTGYTIYLLWDGDQSNYKAIPQGWPDIKLTFGLRCDVENTSEGINLSWTTPINGFGSTSPTIIDSNDFLDDSSMRKSFTDKLMGAVNDFVVKKAVNESRFYQPFFLRYAFRLFDGSYVAHSAPVLMLPATGMNPLVFNSLNSRSANANTGFDYGICSERDYIYLIVGDIWMKAELPVNLLSYKEIIYSVDIFVTSPMYTYNQSGTIERYITRQNLQSKGLYSQLNVAGNYQLRPGLYDLLTGYGMRDTLVTYKTKTGYNLPNNIVELPPRDFTKDIEDIPPFYLVKSFTLEELAEYVPTQQQSFKKIEIEKGILSSLTTRTTLPDDYDSHNTIAAKGGHVYNSRMHLYNISSQLMDGYYGASQLDKVFETSETTQGTPDYVFQDDTTSAFVADKIFVYVKKDKGTIIVEEQKSVMGMDTWTGTGCKIPFFYYPDKDAYKAEFVGTNGNDIVKVELPLKPHGLLNGAYYFSNFAEQTCITISEEPAASTDKSYKRTNKIYVSEVENPMYFPVLGITTVGVGSIMSVCSATTALSQGQFGQFPLYVFSTDGVWALAVSSTGTYSSCHPVSRDILVNPDCVLPIDQAVLFGTANGIMLLSGSSTQSITDTINTDKAFLASNYPKFDVICDMLQHSGSGATNFVNMVPFPDFVTRSKMLYNYRHKHILIFSTDKNGVIFPYSYLYSMKSKKWGTIQSYFQYSVTTYPDTLAVSMPNDKSNTLAVVSFNGVENTAPKTGLMVTRPIKLGASDTLKEIKTLIQRGFFARGEVATVLYGSRDLINWHLVGSSTDNFLRHIHGTGYKYFRIAAITNLTAEHSLHGASIEAKARHTDKLR